MNELGGSAPVRFLLSLSAAGEMAEGKREERRRQQRRRIWLAVAILLLLCAGAAAWKWTPLAEFLDAKRLASWGNFLRNHPARYFYVLAIYIIGSVLSVPITVLILLTAIVFGPIWGSVYALVGSLAGAAVTYAIGYLIGQDLVRKIAGAKWSRLEKKINQAGVVAVATLRLLPVAPFTVVNVVSGAFKVPLRDYVIGSFLGLFPGIIVTNLFARQFERAFRDPGIGTFAILALLIVITVAGTVWLKRKLAE
jgi:phospholipase D1/2